MIKNKFEKLALALAFITVISGSFTACGNSSKDESKSQTSQTEQKEEEKVKLEDLQYTYSSAKEYITKTYGEEKLKENGTDGEGVLTGTQTDADDSKLLLSEKFTFAGGKIKQHYWRYNTFNTDDTKKVEDAAAKAKEELNKRFGEGKEGENNSTVWEAGNGSASITYNPDTKDTLIVEFDYK